MWVIYGNHFHNVINVDTLFIISTGRGAQESITTMEEWQPTPSSSSAFWIASLKIDSSSKHFMKSSKYKYFSTVKSTSFGEFLLLSPEFCNSLGPSLTSWPLEEAGKGSVLGLLDKYGTNWDHGQFSMPCVSSLALPRLYKQKKILSKKQKQFLITRKFVWLQGFYWKITVRKCTNHNLNYCKSH